MSVVLLIMVWLSSAGTSLLRRVTTGRTSLESNPPCASGPTSSESTVVAGSPKFGELGQTTAEYALVLIGAAALAFLLISWAAKSDQIGKLFDFVIQHITGNVR